MTGEKLAYTDKISEWVDKCKLYIPLAWGKLC